MTLNSVVLPAPLGPMSPVTAPASTRRDTSVSAATPPKRTLTRSTSSAGAAPARPGAGAGGALRRHGPLRGRGRARRSPRRSSPKGRCTRLVSHAMPRIPSGWRASSTIPMPAASPVRSASEVGRWVWSTGSAAAVSPPSSAPVSGADAPDRDEEEQGEAGEELHVVGADAALLPGVEHAAQPGHGGREGEDDHFGAHRAEPEGGEGGGRVAHGHQPASEGAASHQADEQGAQRGGDRHLDRARPGRRPRA